MDKSIVVALVSGCFAILGPIITFVATRHYEKRFLQPISRNRRQALIGRWSGRIVQENVASDIEITIDVVRNEIAGKAQLTRTVEEKDRFIFLDLNGGFLYERFLKLDYKNSDSNTIQFGSVTLELDDEGISMNGKFSGYGSISRSIVFGDIHVEKK